MVREITDASPNYGNKDIEDGNWDFTILGITKKLVGKNKDVPAYILKVKYEQGTGEQMLMSSMMGSLLRVLGAKEISPNKFEWDTEDYDGKTFNATITREADKDNPSKIYQKMGKFQPPMKKPEPEIEF